LRAKVISSNREDLVSLSSRFRDNFHPSGFPSHPEGAMPGYIDVRELDGRAFDGGSRASPPAHPRRYYSATFCTYVLADREYTAS